GLPLAATVRLRRVHGERVRRPGSIRRGSFALGSIDWNASLLARLPDSASPGTGQLTTPHHASATTAANTTGPGCRRIDRGPRASAPPRTRAAKASAGRE